MKVIEETIKEYILTQEEAEAIVEELEEKENICMIACDFINVVKRKLEEELEDKLKEEIEEEISEEEEAEENEDEAEKSS